MQNKIHFRRAIESDAIQIAKVHIASWQAIYRNRIPENILNNLSLAKREQEWLTRLSMGAIAWIIELDKQIIGFASICPACDKDDNPKDVAEINALYLLPEFWRQGFGTKLCQVIFDDAKKLHFKEIALWVLESNFQARRFYEAMNFFTLGDKKIDRIDGASLEVIHYRKKF